MNALMQLMEYVPPPIRMMMLGAVMFAGAEFRYMTVADFTKSYVLDLKSEIRELRKELKTAESDGEKALIQEQIEIMLDDLCYETNDKDSYCKDRS